MIYRNPLFEFCFADPSILKDGDDYWMTSQNYPGTSWKGMLMWHSRDLVNWEPLYYVVENDPVLCSKARTVWSPDLVKHGDRYYIYNCGPSVGCFVLWTDDIWKGNWNGPYPLDVVGIDPGHVADDDGRRYIAINRNMIYPLSDDGLSISGPGREFARPWPIPEEWEIEGVPPSAMKRWKYPP